MHSSVAAKLKVISCMQLRLIHILLTCFIKKGDYLNQRVQVVMNVLRYTKGQFRILCQLVLAHKCLQRWSLAFIQLQLDPWLSKIPLTEPFGFKEFISIGL